MKKKKNIYIYTKISLRNQRWNSIIIWMMLDIFRGFPGGSDGKESACNAGDLGLIPGLGRSLGEGNDNPFQYSRWRIQWSLVDYSPCSHKELDMTEQLTLTFLHFFIFLTPVPANNLSYYEQWGIQKCTIF